jgi:RimJ/RimL family protein N-acetyltransferase
MREYFMKTERIGFTKWKEEDADLARSLWGDENVTTYLCASGKFTEQEILQRLHLEIENDKKYGVQYWPVFHLENEDLIGCCGLRPHGPDEDAYEIGFHLREKYWGMGLATEGAKAVIHYAIHQLHAKDLFAGHHPQNAGSKRVLEKLGFRSIGVRHYAATGLFHPSYQYPLCGE